MNFWMIWKYIVCTSLNDGAYHFQHLHEVRLYLSPRLSFSSFKSMGGEFKWIEWIIMKICISNALIKSATVFYYTEMQLKCSLKKEYNLFSITLIFFFVVKMRWKIWNEWHFNPIPTWGRHFGPPWHFAWSFRNAWCSHCDIL